MPLPSATYRVQFNARFTFRDALALLDDLRDLGITHLYASPILAARPGSMHGYDVVDPSRLNPELGDAADFERLSAGLAERGMGLILDVVPNHMSAADPGNRWWQDVLERGPESPYARYFDIDFHPTKVELTDKILLPILGAQFGRVLENQEIQVRYEDGGFEARYYDRRLPLNLPSWKMILGEVDPIAAALIDRIERPYESRKEDVRAELRARYPDGNGALGRAIERLNGRKGDPRSFDDLEAVLAQQAYRLSFWRVAADEINYRRFFDVNDLVAIRVEEPEVFTAVHDLIARLVRDGHVDGLRIDHVDGLLEPARYLEELRQLVGPDRLLLVEKILEPAERLETSWPVDGTTGYDFLNVLNGLYVEPSGLESIVTTYEAFTHRSEIGQDVVYRSKRLILGTSMSGELHVLALRLDRISEQHRWSRDFTLNSLERALAEVIACFPVYRTYTECCKVRPFDEDVVHNATENAKARNPATDPSIFDFLEEVLLLKDAERLTREHRAARLDFVLRFQQLTGPVMAKGLEDTAFYRRYPLASLCEVGGRPDHRGTSIESFHAHNQERLARWRRSLSATSTHDTKRGEDVRARLNVLTEVAEEWRRALVDWRRLNEGERPRPGVPDANEEYLIYQTLVGTHPAAAERIEAYMTKALREAKLHSSWISPNEAYEGGVREFIRRIMRPEHAFLTSLDAFVRRVAPAGLLNGLSQTLLKIASPGIPDFYQGCQFLDFRLVDPDNRAPVDYHAERSADDRRKTRLIREALRFRRAHAPLFLEGDYIPLAARGLAERHVIAFARRLGPEESIVVTGRFLASAPDASGTTIPVRGTFRDVLSGERFETSTDLDVARLLPAGLLERLG